MPTTLLHFLAKIATDPHLLEAYLNGPEATMRKFGLSEDDIELLLSHDTEAVEESACGPEGQAIHVVRPVGQGRPGYAPPYVAGAVPMAYAPPVCGFILPVFVPMVPMVYPAFPAPCATIPTAPFGANPAPPPEQQPGEAIHYTIARRGKARHSRGRGEPDPAEPAH